MTERDFQLGLLERFRTAGHEAHDEVWCTVYDDSGSGDGARRADLYVRFRQPIEGWLWSLAIECKGPSASTGDLRTGVHQAIAYTRAFDWRLHKPRNSRERGPLPRPDLVAFTTPELFERDRRHPGADWFERELWDNGGGLLEDSSGGVRIRYLERTLVLLPLLVRS